MDEDGIDDSVFVRVRADVVDAAIMELDRYAPNGDGWAADRHLDRYNRIRSRLFNTRPELRPNLPPALELPTPAATVRMFLQEMCHLVEV